MRLIPWLAYIFSICSPLFIFGLTASHIHQSGDATAATAAAAKQPFATRARTPLAYITPAQLDPLAIVYRIPNADARARARTHCIQGGGSAA